MANEWIQSDENGACYNSGSGGFAISQEEVLTAGGLCVIEFSINNMTQGQLILDSIVGKPNFIENGDYQVIGISATGAVTFNGTWIGSPSDVFDGCIDFVQARRIPFIQIRRKTDDVIVFEQTDETGVTAYENTILYNIDWSDIPEGCYYIQMTELGVDYISDCIDLKELHTCSLLLTWTNNDNAYGFNYEDLAFTQKLRLNAKLWKPKYNDDKKEIFTDSAGNQTALYIMTHKQPLLTIAEVPEYLHDAIAIGRNHDDFKVEGTAYISPETDYAPAWRNSSDLAPSEIQLTTKDQTLINSNC